LGRLDRANPPAPAPTGPSQQLVGAE